MPTFDSADGTRLAYHRIGTGEPLICLPGGPMLASAYLGDLGGLSAHRTLVRLDLRGTGGSATPADRSSYRCERMVDDVEALRRHLGLEWVDVLGHSAGGTLALLYAARRPDRLGRLTLVCPSPRAVGLEVTDLDRREVAEQRRGEPWFPDAFAAGERIWSGRAGEADWAAIVPFKYGRWDDASRAMESSERNADAAAEYYAGGVTVDPADVRAPVLFLAAEYDIGLPPKRAAEYAGRFRDVELVIQPGGGHFPWLDDPQWFVETLVSRAAPPPAPSAGAAPRDPRGGS